jgi:drug/metabolite transporter (DMT)-like permease
MQNSMTRAALIMFVAMSFIPAGDAAGKLLSTSGIAPVFVAWSRFLLGALMVLPLFGREGMALLRDWRIWLRGALITGGIWSIQTALQSAPLGDVFAAFFIGPIFSYVLAGLLLGEKMSWQRSLLVIMGFAGVLLVVRPGGEMAPGLIFAVLAGLFYGAFLTATRWLSGVGSPGAMTLSHLVIGAVLLTPLGYPQMPEITASIAVLTIASAAFSMLGNLMLIYAYRIAPATQLAPLVYFQLFAAVALGWAIFGDLPDAWTWTGIALILSAGVAAARLR